jgi:propionate CoA-transferase
VNDVEQITFSGSQAIAQEQQVLYVTERCVFELKPDGLHLSEVAPGVDVDTDILDRMAFRPIVDEPLATMAAEHFMENP